MTTIEKKTGIIWFTNFTEVMLLSLPIAWTLLSFYFPSDGAQSISDYFFYHTGFQLLAILSFVFLFVFLRINVWKFQGVLTLFRRPVTYIVLLSLFGSYLLDAYAYIPFEIRFKLSQQALESFAENPTMDNDSSTVQWVGLFPLREVDVAGKSVRMIVAECHLFDDCGFVYSPDGEPPRIGEDNYSKLPFAESWYYWHRSW